MKKKLANLTRQPVMCIVSSDGPKSMVISMSSSLQVPVLGETQMSLDSRRRTASSFGE